MATGDHIYVRRRLGYSHHGIDCGDGSVIHFTGEPGQSKRNASIARTPLKDFLQDGKILVRLYGERLRPEDTVVAAESRVGESGYNLAFNNCEHFSFWCCTGRMSSEQVRRVGAGAGQGAVAGTALAGGVGVVSAVGVVEGLSGAGIMSGLAAAGGVVGSGAIAGPAVLGVVPAALSIGITQVALRDDVALDADERSSRREGRAASVVGAVGATAGGVVAIGASGSVAGLSAAGITSGLAGIGAIAGGGMAAGTAIVIAAPAVAAAGAAAGVYIIGKNLRRQRLLRNERR